MKKIKRFIQLRLEIFLRLNKKTFTEKYDNKYM